MEILYEGTGDGKRCRMADQVEESDGMQTPGYMLAAYVLTVIVGALLVGWIIVKGMNVDHRQKTLDEEEWGNRMHQDGEDRRR